MATHREVERKYDVGEDFRLPELSVDGVVVGAPVVHDLSATYFDTADYRLARARITLRRRTGGADAGWHLKLPRLDGTRDEVHVPLGRSTKPPASLVSKVRVHVRDVALQPVASIRTTRTAYPLLGAGGNGDAPASAVLAEVADDVVTAQALGDTVTLTSWREVEVELVTGEPAILDTVEHVLLDGGAAPASGPSKLARVLAERVPHTTGASHTDGSSGEVQRKQSKKKRKHVQPTAGDVVLAHISAQAQALMTADPWVRADKHDAVHKMRVATRRLRSALSTFRPYLDRERTDPLRDELRWLAGVLGDARDAEVMHARLRAALDAVSGEVSDPASSVAGDRVDADLLGRYRQAHAEAVRVLDGQRYFRLLDALDAVVTDPPFTDRASRPATKELPARVRKTWRSLEALAAAADAATDAGERETALHEVRKAAKRARYAGEALTPAFGEDAARFAAAMESLQEVLGDIQDSVVTRAELRAMAARAHAAGEDTFPYGRLAGLEEARAERIAEDYADALRAAARTARKSWPR